LILIDPIRQLSFKLALKHISGEAISPSEKHSMAAYRETFQDRRNVVGVRCTNPSHQTIGAFAFQNEIINGARVGNIKVVGDLLICSDCGDHRNVEHTIVNLDDALSGTECENEIADHEGALLVPRDRNHRIRIGA
jgi:hypothetical protein